MKVLVEKLGTPSAEVNSEANSQMQAARTPSAVSFPHLVMNKWYEQQNTRLRTIEFSRDRKTMSVLVRSRGATQVQNGCEVMDVPLRLLVKGAPESVLERCTKVQMADGSVQQVTPNARNAIMTKFQEYADRHAFRVLAMAYVDENASLRSLEHNEKLLVEGSSAALKFEQDMTFVGLTAMQDPPRPEVKDSIRQCSEAGIKVVVISGDNKSTVEAVCKAVGIFAEDEDTTGTSYTG